MAGGNHERKSASYAIVSFKGRMFEITVMVSRDNRALGKKETV